MSSSSTPDHFSTPTDREKQRRSQYKSGGRSSTPEWRARYRQRCLDRLKMSRERLVSRFRQMETGSTDPDTAMATAAATVQGSSSMYVSHQDAASSSSAGEGTEGGMESVVVSVKEVMEKEWEVMRTEHTDLPQITPHRNRKRVASLFDSGSAGSCKRKTPSNPVFSSDEEYEESEDINYILSIIDDLTQELILEEQAMLVQCRDRQLEMDLRLYEESSLCAAAMDSLSSTTVVCPLCQKDILHQDVRSIHCSCGLQINTIHDGLSLDFLRQQLETCVTQHSAICSGKPVFSLECNLGIQNLIMNCSSCDFMYIII